MALALGLVAAVDIGGTKIAGAMVDASGTIRSRASRPTPAGGSKPIMAAIVDLLTDLTSDQAVLAIGVGAPGVIDPATGTVTSATDIVPGWSGTPVGGILRQQFGVPVAVDNDVTVMAFGECQLGAGRHHGFVLYVSVGTGVGGAITRDGALLHGRHGSAGLIAHLLVPVLGRVPCGCGRFDHLEAVAAGPAIVAAYALSSGNSTITDLRAVERLMRTGDPHAGAAITGAATVLGRALSGVVTLFDFDAVVIGGGVAQIGPAFLEPVRTALAAEALPEGRDTPVLAASLGTDAPLAGAALLAHKQAYRGAT